MQRVRGASSKLQGVKVQVVCCTGSGVSSILQGIKVHVHASRML